MQIDIKLILKIFLPALLFGIMSFVSIRIGFYIDEKLETNGIAKVISIIAGYIISIILFKYFVYNKVISSK